VPFELEHQHDSAPFVSFNLFFALYQQFHLLIFIFIAFLSLRHQSTLVLFLPFQLLDFIIIHLFDRPLITAAFELLNFHVLVFTFPFSIFKLCFSLPFQPFTVQQLISIVNFQLFALLPLELPFLFAVSLVLNAKLIFSHLPTFQPLLFPVLVFSINLLFKF